MAAYVRDNRLRKQRLTAKPINAKGKKLGDSRVQQLLDGGDHTPVHFQLNVVFIAVDASEVAIRRWQQGQTESPRV
jgi:hypothetical protein